MTLPQSLPPPADGLGSGTCIHKLVAAGPSELYVKPRMLGVKRWRMKAICLLLSIYVCWHGAQYLDLTRLDLVMQDGRREELVRQPGPVVTTWSRRSGRTDSYASGEPVRFYFGQPQSERIFFKRRGRWLERVVMDPATPGQACFYATLWPPTEKVTLIAEGTIHRELCREDQPFRQVSTWKITRGWGLRRVWLP